MIHRRRLLAAAAAIAAVAGVVSYASAAALSVSAATLTSVTVGNPCTGTATTGNPVSGSTATTVNVTLPPECVVTPRTVQVTVVDSGGAHSSASVVMSGPTQAFTVSPAYTAGATVTPSVTVDGWNVAATWSFTPLVSCRAINNPALTCNATLSRITLWGNPLTTHFNAYFQVASPSAVTGTEWEITINFADSTFPFVPVALDHNNHSELASGWTCGQMPLLVLNGQTGSSTALVGGGKGVEVYLQARTTSTGDLVTCP